MLKFNPTTPIKLYEQTTAYVSGQGESTVWLPIVTDGNSSFYCEWAGSFGDRAMSAQALGVKDSATIKTFYNPAVYEKLRTTHVIVIKNADATAFVEGEPNKNNPNVYELWGGVDNVKEANQYIEFLVRRYEGL